MLNQPDPKTLHVIEFLNRDPGFGDFKEYLKSNIPALAHLTVHTNGVTKDEYSGAYKLLEELLGILSLEQYQAPPEIDKRFE